MNILLNGRCGFMGREVAALCEKGYRGAKLLLGVDPSADGKDALCVSALSKVQSAKEIDCVVDFSHHSCAPALLDFCKENKLAAVIATTGHTPEEKEAIYRAAKEIPVFYSGNMSLGIALLIELARTVALTMPEAEIEIVEAHHNRKIDAPSGTALMIADAITAVRPETFVHAGRSGQGKREKNEIGIHSLRMGNVVGIHEVIVATENQTITLKHEAHNRALFAEGALAAAEFLCGKGAGLYTMDDIVANGK
ncbi:MAG: 4-hydroxy-tetrahydrodipicolinate reductase [Clostridia bacterium]|nr:4-hydroxy-tetrahydrodipicolinate reductase [Clostridia bacterium]